jgi:hypothetical protein
MLLRHTQQKKEKELLLFRLWTTPSLCSLSESPLLSRVSPVRRPARPLTALQTKQPLSTVVTTLARLSCSCPVPPLLRTAAPPKRRFHSHLHPQRNTPRITHARIDCALALARGARRRDRGQASWNYASPSNLVHLALPIAFPNLRLPQHTNFPFYLSARARAHTHTVQAFGYLLLDLWSPIHACCVVLAQRRQRQPEAALALPGPAH